MAADLSAAVTAGAALTDVGHALGEAFDMFWDTLWALVLGFTLSGAVQAFVPRQVMQRHLGNHRPGAVARASAYGMVSSSCSYAASAVARALVARGADFVTAMVFMVASTNLVVELGLVLLVLLGWPFLAAELVGGVVMVVLLASLGGLWLRGRVVLEARRRVGADAGPDRPGADAEPLRRRLRSAAGWSDAAGYALGDLRMLRRELLIGFTVGGLLAVLVPTHLWADVFLRGHGVWTTLEDAAAGPLVAIVSFVCSVGNVPLATALWHGGISFGGVVAFVFADLISFPLLLVYRRQYGGRMARRMLVVLWPVMSAAGLATQAIFGALGLVPRAPAGRPAAGVVAWNATTALDLVALGALAGLWWLHRKRGRLGGGAGTAAGNDPVCCMHGHAP